MKHTTIVSSLQWRSPARSTYGLKALGSLVAMLAVCLYSLSKQPFGLTLHAPPAVDPISESPHESSTPPTPQITPPPAKDESTSHTAVTVQSGDTMSSIFSHLGLAQSHLSMILHDPHVKQAMHLIHPGQTIHMALQDHNLQSLRMHIPPHSILQVTRQGDRFTSDITAIPLTTQQHVASGTITHSLFADGHSVGIHPKLLQQLVDIFAWDIDFAQDLRSGDHFSLLYDAAYANHKLQSTGHVLAATFTANHRTYQAVRYTNPKGITGYYTPEGKSLKKAFLRTPVKFQRISSHFNLKRYHPVLNRIRAHRGVDYAAPRGEPVFASGQGRVHFVGTMRGYGNVIILQHGQGYSTLYAHLSRFARSLHTGQTIQQGQTIGFVGSTGLATAPHLHYEFRVNGQHKNPLKVRLPQAAPIPAAWRNHFHAQSKALMQKLQSSSSRPHNT